jgi:hypothetical protein
VLTWFIRVARIGIGDDGAEWAGSLHGADRRSARSLRAIVEHGTVVLSYSPLSGRPPDAWLLGALVRRPARSPHLAFSRQPEKVYQRMQGDTFGKSLIAVVSLAKAL